MLGRAKARPRRRRPRLRQAGVQAARLRDGALLGPLRAQPQDHERHGRVRARLRLLSPRGLRRFHHACARHEQLPPLGAERLRGGRTLGARDEQALTGAAAARAGSPREGWGRGRCRARLGSAAPQDETVLPRLPRGGARAHALRLRLARRRRRCDLERATGLVRRRRHPPHEGTARDLQLRHGAAVGEAGPDRQQPLPPWGPLCGRDDAGHADLRLRPASAGGLPRARERARRRRRRPRLLPRGATNIIG